MEHPQHGGAELPRLLCDGGIRLVHANSVRAFRHAVVDIRPGVPRRQEVVAPGLRGNEVVRGGLRFVQVTDKNRVLPRHLHRDRPVTWGAPAVHRRTHPTARCEKGPLRAFGGLGNLLAEGNRQSSGVVAKVGSIVQQAVLVELEGLLHPDVCHPKPSLDPMPAQRLCPSFAQLQDRARGVGGHLQFYPGLERRSHAACYLVAQ